MMIDENKESEFKTTTINFSEDDIKTLSINGKDIKASLINIPKFGSAETIDVIDAFNYAVNNIVEQDSTALKSRLNRIQESLGCPIGVFFKALKYGIVIKTHFWQGPVYHVEAAYLNGEFCFRSVELLGIHIECLPLKEFNKTWWAI